MTLKRRGRGRDGGERETRESQMRQTGREKDRPEERETDRQRERQKKAEMKSKKILETCNQKKRLKAFPLSVFESSGPIRAFEGTRLTPPCAQVNHSIAECVSVRAGLNSCYIYVYIIYMYIH